MSGVSKCPICDARVTMIEVSGIDMIGVHRDVRFDGLGRCQGGGMTIAEANHAIRNCPASYTGPYTGRTAGGR